MSHAASPGMLGSRSPVPGRHVTVIDEIISQVAQSPWALPVMGLLVLIDSFTVVIPGEAAVTAFGALAVSTGSPPLAAVIVVAGAAAFAGDLTLYWIGRSVGLQRWRWMRHHRIQVAFAWAGRRLEQRTAVALFVARFIPFARIAVSLTAGASRVGAPRFAIVAAVAAMLWAAYQALVGAAVAAILPGGPVVAVIVSVVVAIALGLGLDAVIGRVTRRSRQAAEALVAAEEALAEPLGGADRVSD
jgi:membrane-associated protein